MNARKLISLIGAVMITGAGVYAMSHSYTHYTAPVQAANTTTMSVVTLPTVEVSATALPPMHPVAVSGGGPVVDSDDSGSALHKTALRLSLPTLRMPYYSFGATTFQIGGN